MAQAQTARPEPGPLGRLALPAHEECVRPREEHGLVPIVIPPNQVRRGSIRLPNIQDDPNSVTLTRPTAADHDTIAYFCIHRRPPHFSPSTRAMLPSAISGVKCLDCPPRAGPMTSRSDCCGASAQDKSVRLGEEQLLVPVVEPANQVRRTSVCLPDLQDLADSVPSLRQETGDNNPIPNFCMHRLPANPPLRLAKASRKWRQDSWMPSPPRDGSYDQGVWAC